MMERIQLTPILSNWRMAVTEVERRKRCDDIRKRMKEIEKEYGGLLSNIPANPGSEYYILRNELNTLETK